MAVPEETVGVPTDAAESVLPLAFMMSVRAVASPHSFAAEALSPAWPSPVSRWTLTPPSVTSMLALIDEAPFVEEAMTTLH
jgi:hypothetical protein